MKTIHSAILYVIFTTIATFSPLLLHAQNSTVKNTTSDTYKMIADDIFNISSKLLEEALDADDIDPIKASPFIALGPKIKTVMAGVHRYKYLIESLAEIDACDDIIAACHEMYISSIAVSYLHLSDFSKVIEDDSSYMCFSEEGRIIAKQEIKLYNNLITILAKEFTLHTNNDFTLDIMRTYQNEAHEWTYHNYQTLMSSLHQVTNMITMRWKNPDRSILRILEISFLETATTPREYISLLDNYHYLMALSSREECRESFQIISEYYKRDLEFIIKILNSHRNYIKIATAYSEPNVLNTFLVEDYQTFLDSFEHVIHAEEIFFSPSMHQQ